MSTEALFCMAVTVIVVSLVLELRRQEQSIKKAEDDLLYKQIDLLRNMATYMDKERKREKMNKLTILRETAATRCDICHQEDLFDRNNNYCSRCESTIDMRAKVGLQGEQKSLKSDAS